MSVQGAGVDHRAEAALEVRPQEGQGGAAELRAEDRERDQQRAAEEVAARDDFGRLRRGSSPAAAAAAARLARTNESPNVMANDVEGDQHDDRRDQAARPTRTTGALIARRTPLEPTARPS